MKAMRRIDIERNLKVISLLNEEKYVLGRKIGEGYNREVYEVIHKKDMLQKMMVAKIYKKEIPTDSVQHKINLSKELKGKELDILSSIWHPNIIQVQDVIAQNGIFIMIEEYFDAISLEDRISIYGPVLNHELFKQIFSQVDEALKYMHVDKKILHRDIKPQNILFGKQRDIVKLTDFQNAARIEDIASKLLPTRGGTQYTHPNLLNSILLGECNNATASTEFYALGITMYYALTGKLPFNFKLSINENGRKIKVNEEEFGVTLSDGNIELKKIEPEYYERKLENELLNVPERYRRLLMNCISLMSRHYDSDNSELLHERFSDDFKHATADRGIVSIDLRKIRQIKELKLKNFPNEPMQAIIQGYAEQVIGFGKRNLKSDSYSEGHGSDAIRSILNRESYSLKQGKFEFNVGDENDYRSGGEWVATWYEKYQRKFQIINDGKILVSAIKVLGGESGNVIEPDKIKSFEPSGWHIEEIGNLEEILHEISGEEIFTCIIKDSQELIQYFENNQLSSYMVYPFEPETNERLSDRNGQPGYKLDICTVPISPEKPVAFKRIIVSKDTVREALRLLSSEHFSEFKNAQKSLESLDNDGKMAIIGYSRKIGENIEWEDC